MRCIGVLLLLAAPVTLDLASIPKRVAHPPRFESEHQYYALLVLGHEAKKRVWLILDGDVLFIDRDGDGSFAGPGERLSAPELTDRGDFYSEFKTWKLARLDRAGRFTDVSVAFGLINLDFGSPEFSPNRWMTEERMASARRIPGANSTRIKLRIDGRQTQFCRTVFRRTPVEAPIIHMDGPLTLGRVEDLRPQRFHLKGKPPDFLIAIGTPGLGIGSFSYLWYDDVPEKARPTIYVEFPKAGGGFLPPERYDLKGRC